MKKHKIINFTKLFIKRQGISIVSMLVAANIAQYEVSNIYQIVSEDIAVDVVYLMMFVTVLLVPVIIIHSFIGSYQRKSLVFGLINFICMLTLFSYVCTIPAQAITMGQFILNNMMLFLILITYKMLVFKYYQQVTVFYNNYHITNFDTIQQLNQEIDDLIKNRSL